MHPLPERSPPRRGWQPVLLGALAALSPDGSAAAAAAAPFPPRLSDPFPAPARLDREGVPPTPTSTHHRHVPPQYSPGPDGIWRRIDSYTLVGSTICDTCTTLPTTSVSLTDDEFMKTVPSGWVRTNSITNPARTSITVALSVGLACFIVFTLIRCHFSMRRDYRRRHDVEKRRSKRARAAESTDDLAASPAPASAAAAATTTSKSRRWMARATARWRDNARYIARQRRGRRRFHSRHSSTESLSIPTAVEKDDGASRPSSPAPSISPPSSPTPSSRSLSASSIASTTSTTSLPLAPPAYPPASPTPRARQKAPALTHDDDEHHDDDGEAFPPYTPQPTEGESSSAGYFAPHPHAAHVATDDKALLARLAERASAPGAEDEENEGEGDRAKAPEEDDLDLDPFAFGWVPPAAPEDDEQEDEEDGRRRRRRRDDDESRPALVLPPPPPRLPAPSGSAQEKMELERAYAAREAGAAVAFDVPSAPAYDDDGYAEAGPSTPRRVLVVASAPPLELEDLDDDEDMDIGEVEPGLEYADDDGEDTRPGPAHGEDAGQDEGDARRRKRTTDVDDVFPAEESPRHAPMSAGEAHDTGWGG